MNNEEPPHKEAAGWAFALILVLLYALIFWPKPGQAAESPNVGTTWLVIPVTSWHEVDKKYNENNWGLGIEYQFNSNWSIIGGGYENSIDATTLYVGGVYSPSFLQYNLQQIHIKSGVMLGVFSGYADKNILISAPTLQIEIDKKVGIDFLLGCTNFRCKEGVIGLSFKFTKGVLE